MLQGEYAYNRVGTGPSGLIAAGAGGGLGLGPRVELSGNAVIMFRIPESRVLVPSEMIAVGDAYDEPFKPQDDGTNAASLSRSRLRSTRRSRNRSRADL